MSFASGLSSKADKNKITLSRLSDQGEREFFDYSLKDINSVELKDSDEIFIHDLSGKLSNNIRIEGFLSNRGIYSFIENSKISDFIDENDLRYVEDDQQLLSGTRSLGRGLTPELLNDLIQEKPDNVGVALRKYLDSGSK